jgi:hypothetical protein
LPEELIYERSLPVVDVRDDRNIPDLILFHRIG